MMNKHVHISIEAYEDTTVIMAINIFVRCTKTVVNIYAQVFSKTNKKETRISNKAAINSHKTCISHISRIIHMLILHHGPKKRANLFLTNLTVFFW